jgi:hypothetical protein
MRRLDSIHGTAGLISVSSFGAGDLSGINA